MRREAKMREFVKNGAVESKPEESFSFRVTCNRAGEKSRHNFSSMDAARALGGIINRVFGWRPDMENFDMEVLLNIRNDMKKLTVVRHEIASANYKIDDAWKKSERDPKSLDKLRELKESRRRSESELLRKIDKTKERMRKSYEQKERQHGAHRDQSPRPSTSRGGV
ncbi:THUMP domain protein [Ostertagia ostertagi]